MKIIPKKMRERWEPILQGWLDAAGIDGDNLSIRLYVTKDMRPNERGRVMLGSKLIKLPVGSNDLDEIKFCFFHEIGHIRQIEVGWLSISALQSVELRLFEYDAHAFALKHGAQPSDYVRWCWQAWGLDEEKLRGKE